MACGPVMNAHVITSEKFMMSNTVFFHSSWLTLMLWQFMIRELKIDLNNRDFKRHGQ